MSGNQPTTEDFLNMDGGIDPSKISDNPADMIPTAPAEVPIESQSNIKRRLESSIESFLDSNTAIEQATGRPNVQFSNVIEESIKNNIQMPQPMNIDQARGLTPIERFKQFIKTETLLNPKFDVYKDLDGMIDYIIAQENLEAKFAAFNTSSTGPTDDIYRG